MPRSRTHYVGDKCVPAHPPFKSARGTDEAATGDRPAGEAVTAPEKPCEACGQDSDFQRRQAIKICDLEAKLERVLAALQEWVWAKDSTNGDTNTYFERLNLAEAEARRVLGEGKA